MHEAKSGAFSCLLIHSCSAMDRHMQQSVFHTIAFLAFSTPATWCRIFMSRKFMSRIAFQRPQLMMFYQISLATWQKVMAAYCQVYGVIHVTSPAGWLPVHRDQLRAQRSVTSLGKLYLFYLDSGDFESLWIALQATALTSCVVPGCRQLHAISTTPRMSPHRARWQRRRVVRTTTFCTDRIGLAKPCDVNY